MNRDYLLECFHYEHDTGQLIWKTRPLEHFKSYRSFAMANGKYANKVAGVKQESRNITYIRIKMNGKSYLAHRIIWVMFYGEWPDYIDHINGDGEDNRLENLRNVSISLNNKNCRRRLINSSGVTGVYWYAHLSKWSARIGSDNEQIHLGVFNSWFDAVCARKSAEYKYSFHANHDRI